MIPADLAAITWNDIKALVMVGREEDDTIEFKSQFTGSSDFLALNENQRTRAVDGIAREAIAFLNTRGGDVVIGVKEASGAHPRAEEVTPVEHAQESADRLARALAAVIEPAQTSLSVRAISDPTNVNAGVIVVRVRASLRAPHRSKHTKECYARRGTESVPMPMDEVQDLTLYRARIRMEQFELLDRQFADFVAGRWDQRSLPSPVVYLRAVFFPINEQEIEIDDRVLVSMGNRLPPIQGPRERDDALSVPFHGLTDRWKPMLRGKKREVFDRVERPGGPAIQFAGKRISANGVATFNYAAVAHTDNADAIIYYAWMAGFLAQIVTDIRALVTLHPGLIPAVLRVGIYVNGRINLAMENGFWRTNEGIPVGQAFLPDFSIGGIDALNEFFVDSQADILGYCEVDQPPPYSFTT